MVSKRICVLNPYIATLGGGEKHMGYFLQFLEERYQNIHIDIIVHNYNDIDVHSDHYMTIGDLNRKFNLNLQHTELLKVDLEQSNNIIAKAKNKKIIENLTRGYDIFINNMFLSKHIGKAKFNIYECMFPPHTFVQENREGVPQLMATYLDKAFYKSYDKFVSISYFTNHWLNTYWKNITNKCTVIYPPVFTEEEMKGRYREGEKKNIIISVGRFFIADHCKRQLDMVSFFVDHQDVFKDYEYHLVGSVASNKADAEYFDQVCKVAHKVNNVIIHKDCPYKELMELYTKAKMFWHATGYTVDENKNPEKMEHFGITTVEAMSFGAVPVVINKGGQRETVIHGENGFLWNTEEECVENTLKLIRDERLRKRFAEASVERAKLYSIDEFFRQNRRLFDEIGL